MLEKARKRFATFVMPKMYLGTDELFEDQIIEPLIAGTKRNVFQNSDAEKVATAVTCIKVLGDTLARLPINVYQSTDSGSQIDKQDYRYDLLHYSPDGMITSNTFFGALEYQRNSRGNSFARIYRDRLTGRATKIEFIPSNMVGGYKMVRGQLYYIVYEKKANSKDTKEVVVNANDMLHFKMITKNSIWGINPIEVQRMNLSTLWKAKNTVDSFYENNAFSPKVLKSQIPDAQFQKQFAESMKDFKNTNVGPMNAGNVIKLPPFTEIQELSLDPVDAKFIESTKFDTTQIAAFYGVPPDMVGVYDFSKYNNVEQARLGFRVDTIAGIARMYRQELEFKLFTSEERKAGKSIEFVTQAMMELDVATRTAYYKTMQDLGVMTPNQIALLEGLPTFDDGDKHYMSSQTLPIEDRDKVTTEAPPPEDQTEDI